MKKAFILLFAILMLMVLSISASAAEEKVVIDNVVYELTSHKTYGQHYVVKDFFDDEALAETTTKIKIVDEIYGIEVLGINTNMSACEDYAESIYDQQYPSVKKISMPTTIKYIGAYAFSFFPSVEKIQLPAELENISEGTFYSMDSLKSITLPKGITGIDYYTFENCKSLEKVVFQGNVRTILEGAFCGCEKLSSVNFPDSLEEIGQSAFSGAAFKKIVLPAGVNLSEGPFDSCNQLEKIVFESDKPVDYIGVDGFYGCQNLKGIYIKAIATEAIFLDCITDYDMHLPLLETIYFEGSEKLWNELTSKNERELMQAKDINVEFYYKHSHSFVRNGNPTCKKGGTYTCTCDCGDSYKITLAKDPNAHKYGSWKVTREATYLKEGLKTRTCKYCGYIQKANIRKLFLYPAQRLKVTEIKKNEVTLTWEAPENATGYRIYQYDEANKKYVKLASIKNKTTYTIKNLEHGKDYKFAVEAYNKSKNGDVAFAKKATTNLITKPIAPENLRATSTKKGQIELVWDSCGEDAGYEIIYASTSKEDVGAGHGTYVPSSENKKTIKKLTSGETYYCVVFNYGENSVKQFSNIVEVTVM